MGVKDWVSKYAVNGDVLSMLLFSLNYKLKLYLMQ